MGRRRALARFGTIRARAVERKAESEHDRVDIAFGGALPIDVVLWSATDEHTLELPAQQTLERLVCAAMRPAFPDRAKAVAKWLELARPLAAERGPKEYSWSHMAGWFADGGCDDFYRAVWRDEEIAKALEARLRAIHAWNVIEQLAT